MLLSINAHPHGIVYEVAKVASPVGSHGPALINLHWPNVWPGSYWGNGLGGGSAGIQFVLTISIETLNNKIIHLGNGIDYKT